jgi:hypothetical protein
MCINGVAFSGYRLKLHLIVNRNMLVSHLEVGTPMIRFAGQFPKKSSCKVRKSYRSVYKLMDTRCKDCRCL